MHCSARVYVTNVPLSKGANIELTIRRKTREDPSLNEVIQMYLKSEHIICYLYTHVFIQQSAR
jgi:hypothetical protein